MFELHCCNNHLWTWNYQWTYACWNHNGLYDVPHKNIVSKIVIGTDASNTKIDKRVALFLECMESIEFLLVHPIIIRDKGFESRYRPKKEPIITRQFKNFLKLLPNNPRKPIKR